MKKRLIRILSAFACSAFFLTLAACGSGVPSPESVANRLNGGESLSDKDYTAMIDYCGKYAKEAQTYYDIINGQPNDSTATAIDAGNDLAALYGSYPYLDLFRTTLSTTELSSLSQANQKKVEKYAQYQDFPLPQGAGQELQDPQVAGMIEETPDSDTSGIIATGDGEAIDIKVK